MFTKLNRVFLASGLVLTSLIGFGSSAFAADEVRGTASNQITGNLDASASISWPQPNAFAIQKPEAGATANLVQYITLSTNVSYDANVPWEIKAHSLNSSSLVNSADPTEKIAYKFSLGIGSQGTTSVTAPFVTLVNTASGVEVVSGIPGQGELVPKLELTVPMDLTAGQFNDTITLFMVTP